ncbi:hypothetical protein [Pedobacter boryungensis]|uniref:Uncharacterized protein n=1 Tax=Pedobacter boryungensis TaxID=869962 RepID=A0ABX2DAK8_9SPHI|nr:hypothetical protein [Pedobacter boryungensis]NQX31079.1 hypothetical protein [Pedobacter boryungensis]
MAHLEVEPKPKRPWWFWLLTIIVLILVGLTLVRKCDAEKSDAMRAQKDTTTIFDTSAPYQNVSILKIANNSVT